jgi:hypothetical protein
MGKLAALLASILFSTAPLASAQALESSRTEMTQVRDILGRDTVSSVRESYEKGSYIEFLSKMDSSYRDADLDGLIQMRQRDVPLEFQDLWEEKFLSLQNQKSRDLMKVVSDFDDSIFADKVRSIASTSSTPEQEKAVSRLNALIAKAPNSGMNADENKLIDIDLEFEYKLLHAKFPMSDISPQERSAHQLVLKMHKMDKMVEASKSFQDLELKMAVKLAAAQLDDRLARNLDGADLNNWVRSEGKPTTELEGKVFSIISSYQGQFDDLMKELSSQVS